MGDLMLMILATVAVTLLLLYGIYWFSGGAKVGDTPRTLAAYIGMGVVAFPPLFLCVMLARCAMGV